jgi:hypothetical protein
MILVPKLASGSVLIRGTKPILAPISIWSSILNSSDMIGISVSTIDIRTIKRMSETEYIKTGTG